MTQPRFYPVIDASKHQPLWLRGRDLLLTIAMWAIYLYLMEDFFTFVVTIFDWEVLGIRHPDLHKAFKILKTMKVYFWIIVINGTILLLWARYNQLRFRGKERRKARAPIGTEELSKLYQIDPQEISRWQQARILIIHHDPQGNIVNVQAR